MLCKHDATGDSLAVLVGGDDSQPVPDIVLLKELLGQVFEVPAARREIQHRPSGTLPRQFRCVESKKNKPLGLPLRHVNL